MSGDGIVAVVVSYRSAETIELCLQRLRAAEGVTAIRVVDNGSDDGTVGIVQRVAASEPRLKFIANPDNPGFAVACNQGAHAATDPWIAFVNPDCLAEPDSLSRMRMLASRVAPALLGCELVDEDGVPDPASRRRDPDFTAMLTAALGAARSNVSVPSNGEPVQVVDAVSGALMLMPRTLFDAAGGFDEGYRLHAEDLDLCRRVRAVGGTVAVANEVRVVHLRGVSSRSRPFFVEWHKHRGLWRYFQCFEAPQRSAPLRAAIGLAIMLRFCFAALRAWLRAVL
ncbi:glycosyltransferase family 2 protein [Cognatilysobacter lacus]|uniref:Glycosyltransferase family 2 protein n=1 Tax=Cognatilysobacter lacus TaxID=1643323 RepID=A0A5D8Z5B4_9GAMM|nr:glycosyltransferase family 2 protein [Lysobacter lacus]TZF89929.1 glycosyltransferase family 2 protein [Lysobacter lacus]